jgi:predicted ferric reductase
MKTSQRLQVGVWGLTILVAFLAILAWGQGNSWNVAHISNYNLFPIFGLMAFSIMWAHYIAAALRVGLKVDKAATKNYFEITSLMVLGCILLHPGLLIYQLYRDGFGFPPESYLKNYVAPGLGWAALLGTISFFIFIGYEFHRIYDKKPWWKYMQYASDVAMLLIFLHALKLGRQLGPGWFRVVWWIYGVTLVGAIVCIYINKAKYKTNVSKA